MKLTTRKSRQHKRLKILDDITKPNIEQAQSSEVIFLIRTSKFVVVAPNSERQTATEFVNTSHFNIVASSAVIEDPNSGAGQL